MSKMDTTKTVARLLAISAAFLFGVSSPYALACAPQHVPNEGELLRKAEDSLQQNDSHAAYVYLTNAREAGSGLAYRKTADLFAQGRGVVPNKRMERYMNWMGGQLGDAEAMYRAAVDFYDRGKRSDGERWALAANQCGHEGALVLLVERAILDRRDKEALEFLEEGIGRGVVGAKYLLAEQFHNGALGLPKDHKKAFSWYYLAARGGDARAMNAVAYYFVRGLHGVQDDVAAIHWYHEAAKAGHVESMTAYGWMLANGRGAQVDKAEATHYLQKAKAAGNLAAAKFIAEIKQNHKSASVMQKESNGNLL